MIRAHDSLLLSANQKEDKRKYLTLVCGLWSLEYVRTSISHFYDVYVIIGIINVQRGHVISQHYMV